MAQLTSELERIQDERAKEQAQATKLEQMESKLVSSDEKRRNMSKTMAAIVEELERGSTNRLTFVEAKLLSLEQERKGLISRVEELNNSVKSRVLESEPSRQSRVESSRDEKLNLLAQSNYQALIDLKAEVNKDGTFQ